MTSCCSQCDEIDLMLNKLFSFIGKIGNKVFIDRLNLTSFLVAYTPKKPCKIIPCKNIELEHCQKEVNLMLDFIRRKDSNPYKILSVSFVTIAHAIEVDTIKDLMLKLKIDVSTEGNFRIENNESLKTVIKYMNQNRSSLIVRAKIFNCFGNAINIEFSVDKDFNKDLLKFNHQPYLTEDLYNIQWKIESYKKLN